MALPPFSLIRDFRKQNIFKISVNHTCYRQIGSKSSDLSQLAWRKEGLKVTLVALTGGFRSDLSITRETDRKRFGGCFVFQSRVSTKTVVKSAQETSLRHIWGRKTSFHFISNEKLFIHLFLWSVIFPYSSLHTQAVRAVPRILSLGSLWEELEGRKGGVSCTVHGN